MALSSWVLIVMLFGDGRSVSVIDFNSKASCESAKAELVQEVGRDFKPWVIKAVCAAR